jgi:hypothetical protein
MVGWTDRCKDVWTHGCMDRHTDTQIHRHTDTQMDVMVLHINKSGNDRASIAIPVEPMLPQKKKKSERELRSGFVKGIETELSKTGMHRWSSVP